MSISVPHFASASSDQAVISNASAISEASSQSLALCLAETAEEKSNAAEMLNRRFAWRGYGSDHKLTESESHATFLARVDEEIVGTITLGVDSPNGLAADSLFKSEIDTFRSGPGALVCELTKFAFETGNQEFSNRTLASLFHVVFLYGMHNFNCTDLFIEVNPRHRRFYQAALGFTAIGELRTNPTVDAPSQLMWLNVSRVAREIASCRAHPEKRNSRSLYSLFLTEAEEKVVKSRLEHPRLHGLFSNLVERSLQPASSLHATFS